MHGQQNIKIRSFHVDFKVLAFSATRLFEITKKFVQVR